MLQEQVGGAARVRSYVRCVMISAACKLLGSKTMTVSVDACMGCRSSSKRAPFFVGCRDSPPGPFRKCMGACAPSDQLYWHAPIWLSVFTPHCCYGSASLRQDHKHDLESHLHGCLGGRCLGRLMLSPPCCCSRSCCSCWMPQICWRLSTRRGLWSHCSWRAPWRNSCRCARLIPHRRL